MQELLSIAIFGDSIMKGTLLDEGGRYRPCFNEAVKPLLDRFPISIENHARFGSTIEKGLSTVKKALCGAVSAPRYAVIEFGGNDCNFDWRSVAREPRAEHNPNVPLPKFMRIMGEMIAEHLSAGVTPVLMSLPPVCGERYFSHICSSGLDGGALMSFLGGTDTIDRYQEMYSDAITAYAQQKGLPFIDVRPAFLSEDGAPIREYIASDGLHLSRRGYEVLMRCFEIRLAAVV